MKILRVILPFAFPLAAFDMITVIVDAEDGKKIQALNWLGTGLMIMAIALSAIVACHHLFNWFQNVNTWLIMGLALLFAFFPHFLTWKISEIKEEARKREIERRRDFVRLIVIMQQCEERKFWENYSKNIRSIF